MCMDPVNPKIIAVPDLEVPMIFDGDGDERRIPPEDTGGDIS